MSKSKAQGTAFESDLVRRAQAVGLLSDRLPEGGLRDAGDCWIGSPPHLTGVDIAIVAWSRLVDNGTSRRVADGARSVVVMSTDSFLHIARYAVEAGVSFVAECKATERLNVTRTLDQAERKLAHWKNR